MSLTDETLRALLREYIGAEFSSVDIAELRPHIERQLANSKALQALDLGSDDPAEVHYLHDYRLEALPSTTSDATSRDARPSGTRSVAPSAPPPTLATLTIHELAPLIARRAAYAYEQAATGGYRIPPMAWASG